jgi:hypothetical protein
MLQPTNPASAISLMHCSKGMPMSMERKSSFHHKVGVIPNQTFSGLSFFFVAAMLFNPSRDDARWFFYVRTLGRLEDLPTSHNLDPLRPEDEIRWRPT